MTGSPKNRFELSQQKRALLDALLREEGVGASAPQSIPRRTGDDPLPLSFAQQRLWFLDQLLPANPFYNIPAALCLQTPLNVGAFEQALNEVVRRHESLRTTFATVDGQSTQVIASSLQLPLKVVDLRHLPAEEREAMAVRLATDETQEPFDLSKGPLVRAGLLQLGDAEYVFLLTMHHIISDGWSMGVFFRELTALYAAYAVGRPSPLPELPVQYADYAVWQRGWLRGEVLEEQLAYWEGRLRGLPRLQLPTDRPRPPVQSFRGAVQTLALAPDLTARLRQLSQREGVTLYMTLLAAFQALLARYSGQEDIVVGTPIAGRNRAELEPLIGFFVNTLVLRTTVDGALSFRELLPRVREACLGAYAHQEVPFEMLVERLQPKRDLSRNPLFQVIFQLLSAPHAGQQAQGSGPSVPTLEIKHGTSKFDLTFSLSEGADSIEGHVEYNTDLFEADTINRLARHFHSLLESAAADPERPVSQLPMLSQSERHELLLGWNDTATEYPRQACVHELFEEQAARTPDAVALVFDGRQVSYAELDRRANQLARYLRGRGVAVETLVGVMVGRSAEMVVSLLGVLKAGGAYVPLDAEYPAERLRYMVEDAGVRVVVTQAALVGRLGEASGCETVLVDGQWGDIERESGECVQSGAGAENLAYVMYTSGSMGRPKGVGIPHRAINRLVSNTNYINLGPSDRVAQASNASFDAATFEIWGALLNGARLVGIPKDVALSPHQLAERLREHEVTTLFLTTPLFTQLIGEAPQTFASLKHFLFGGSSADPKPCRETLEQGPPQRLLNVYGPTESTTFATYHVLREVPGGAASIPIGRPVANTEIYILDAQLQPAPVGVAGQLLIGGAGLARGYLGRPELTAEKFIPHPFSREAGARLYQTGDLARFLPDGSVDFIGRIDGQVKLRGYRVELGEIESVLAEHKAVREAVVVAREGEAGDKRLAAYVVPEAGSEVTRGELRAHLRERLPEYMVPASYVMLERLPLTPNGKADRDALPEAEDIYTEAGAQYVAPQTEVEQTIAAVWQDVLGLEKIGAFENFFELGGHSLLMVKVHGRLREVLKKDLTMTDLFRYPTVSTLAKYLSEGEDVSSFQRVQDRARKQRDAMSRRKHVMKARTK